MAGKQEETNVWKKMQLDLSPDGFRLFRNQRYKGKTEKGFWVDCGVGGDGGMDLVGYRKTIITPEMVGKTIAIYTEIDAKTKDGMKRKNKSFIDQSARAERIRLDGGIAGICTCPEDVKKLLTLH